MPTPVWEVAGGRWNEVTCVDGSAHQSTHGKHGALLLVPGARTGVCTVLLDGVTDADRVVASLDADPLSSDASVRLRVRARARSVAAPAEPLPKSSPRPTPEAAKLLAAGSWTPWAPLGIYEATSARSEVGQDPSKLEVDVDTLKLPANHLATALEARLEVAAGSDGASPRIRRLALLAWKKGEAPADVLGARGPAWGKELAVPERSQQALPQELRPRCCSPTSLSMVLAFHGRDLPTEEVCKGVHDEGARIYGNWSFNVAYAGRLGLRAVVGRCTSMVDLDEEIAAGRPVVLSHRYAAGEVQGAAVNGTDGHLIVARGITPDGDVVVNDPAADPLKGQPIRRVYRRADLARSWLGNGSGICYLVRPE